MTLNGGVPLFENSRRVSDRQRQAYVDYLRRGGARHSGNGQLGGPGHGVVASVLSRGAGRVTAINATTREQLQKLIAQAVEQGLSPAEAGDLVQAATGFSEYRAERIARTELMFAYNAAAIQSYGTYGISQVEAIDGDGDEECAARNGQTFDLSEAESIEDHPNGTLDWIPVVGSEPTTPEQPEPEPVQMEPDVAAAFGSTLDEPIEPPSMEQLMRIAPRRETVNNVATGRWKLDDVARERWGVNIEREPFARESNELDAAIVKGVEETRATGVKLRLNKITLMGRQGGPAADGGRAAADMSSYTGEMRIFRDAQDYVGKQYYRKYYDDLGHAMDDFDALIKHELGHAAEYESPQWLRLQWQALFNASKGSATDVKRLTADLANSRKVMRDTQPFLDRYLRLAKLTDAELRDEGYDRAIVQLRIKSTEELLQRLQNGIDELVKMRSDAQALAKLAKYEKIVSAYGESNWREDFAESWVAYWSRPRWFEAHNPQRWKVINDLVNHWKLQQGATA